jgi:hypothetical protein
MIFSVFEKNTQPWGCAKYQDMFSRCRKLMDLKIRSESFKTFHLQQAQYSRNFFQPRLTERVGMLAPSSEHILRETPAVERLKPCYSQGQQGRRITLALKTLRSRSVAALRMAALLRFSPTAIAPGCHRRPVEGPFECLTTVTVTCEGYCWE